MCVCVCSARWCTRYSGRYIGYTRKLGYFKINWNKIFCHFPFNFFAISDRAIIKYINKIGGNEEKILVQIVFTETRFSGTRSTHHLTMRQELKGRNVFQGSKSKTLAYFSLSVQPFLKYVCM